MISNDTRNNRLNGAIKFAQSKKGKVILKRRFQGGVHDKITYCCQNNHEFQKTYHKSVNKKEWCIYWPCNKSKPNYRDQIGFKIFLSRLKAEHQDRIRCLSNLPNFPKKFEFQCKVKGCGHIFEKEPKEILFTKENRKHPPGCEKCGGSFRKTTQEAKELTKKLEITLVSKKMSNVKEKLKLKCPNGHNIERKSFNNLQEIYKDKTRKGPICRHPDCNNVYPEYTLSYIKKFAKDKGLKFRDKIFNGIYKEHEWECIKSGHIFLSTLKSIRKNNTPCPICYKETLYNSISKLADWLKENEPTIKIVKGERYSGNQEKIQIKCSQCGTISRKRPSQILSRSLCDVCSKNKKELIVFQSMSQLFGGQWDYNTKPEEWLVNKNGRKMELDGFCKELNLAFEHHGGQHYRCIPKMTPTSKDLRISEARDKRKERLCYEHGIKLIVIQELESKTIDLKQEIKDQCNGKKILYGGFYNKNCHRKFPLPKDFENKVVKIHNIYNEVYSSRLNKAKEVAKEKNQSIHKSKKGNIFIERRCNLCKDNLDINLYRYIKNEPKCGKCRGDGVDWKSKEKTVNFYKKLAKNNNAKFLTNKWKGWNKQLRFKCNKCSKDPSLIHPYHSEFEIIPQSLNNKFEHPLIAMKLKRNLTFHARCGHFRLDKMSLNDVRKYIKRFEPTAEILITSPNIFIPKKGIKYTFRCSNKRHSPYTFSKNFESISQMRKNNSFGCQKCGQYNRKR